MKRMAVFRTPARERVARVEMPQPGRFVVKADREELRDKITQALQAISAQGRLRVRSGHEERTEEGVRHVTTESFRDPADPGYLEAVGWELLRFGFRGVIEGQ
ncbi:MAG TPA: hypothetical protein VM537_02160 [Anaerolineae bacterium]|nr:hypothetical protein [Anaerolineae bacterium]